MDSRIREIEQWISEAKTDLGERGREAYLNKLYLLDAEIRSVIRENGMQPGAASPQPAGRRVRRPHAFPAFASGAALSAALLLAASTVYFASPGISLPWSRPAATSPLLAMAPAAAAPDHGFTLPEGEELVMPPNPAGAHHLNTLPSSPSEEKAGDTTPAEMQASGPETKLTGNSKPSALAHPSVPAPASSTAAHKPAAPAKAGAPKPTAPPVSLAAEHGAAVPAAAEPKAKPERDATPVVLAAADSAQPVHKPAVDNEDKAHHLDTSVLTKIANASFVK
jgi:hypothetical protein